MTIIWTGYYKKLAAAKRKLTTVHVKSEMRFSQDQAAHASSGAEAAPQGAAART